MRLNFASFTHQGNKHKFCNNTLNSNIQFFKLSYVVIRVWAHENILCLRAYLTYLFLFFKITLQNTENLKTLQKIPFSTN